MVSFDISLAPIVETSVGFVCNFNLIQPRSVTCDETNAILVNMRACNICSDTNALFRLQNSHFRSFRKARSAVSVIIECESREPHTPAGFSRLSPFSPGAVFTLAPDLSFEYGPSLAFAKNTTVLQSTLCSFYHFLCSLQCRRFLCDHKLSVLVRQSEYIRSHVGLLISRSLSYSTRRLFVSPHDSSDARLIKIRSPANIYTPALQAAFQANLRMSEIHSANCS